MELSSSSLVPTRMFGGPLILMSLSEEIDRLILFENWDIVLKNNHTSLDSTISILVGVKEYLTHVTLGYKMFSRIEAVPR